MITKHSTYLFYYFYIQRNEGAIKYLNQKTIIMRYSVILFVSIITILVAGFKDETKAQNITNYYEVKTIHRDSSFYFYETPKILKESRLKHYSETMELFNFYLLNNYSDYDHSKLLNYMPDTVTIKKQFSKMLKKDKKFSNLFFKCFNKDYNSSIHIDSLLKITSRFYYLHRHGGNISFHVCATVNEVLELPQSDISPVYNAFCFCVMANMSRENKSKIMAKLTKGANNDITDVELNSLKNNNYLKVMESPFLRDEIFLQYNKMKEYLNFDIIE